MDKLNKRVENKLDIEVFDEEMELIRSGLGGQKAGPGGVNPINRKDSVGSVHSGGGRRGGGMTTQEKAKLKGAFDSIEHLKTNQKRIDKGIQNLKIDEFRARLDEAEK